MIVWVLLVAKKICWKKNAHAWDFERTKLNEDHTKEISKVALIFCHLYPSVITLKLLVLQYCIKSDIENWNKLNCFCRDVNEPNISVVRLEQKINEKYLQGYATQTKTMIY